MNKKKQDKAHKLSKALYKKPLRKDIKILRFISHHDLIITRENKTLRKNLLRKKKHEQKRI